jgi:hypothetical protein
MQECQCVTHKRLSHMPHIQNFCATYTGCVILCRELTWSTLPGIRFSMRSLQSLTYSRNSTPFIDHGFVTLVHQIQPLEPILSQFNPVHVLIPYFSKIHININPPFCSNLPTPTFTSGYPTKLLYTHLTSPINVMPSPPHTPWLITLPWHIQKKMRYTLNSWGQLAYYQTKYIVQILTLFTKIYEVLWLWVLVHTRTQVSLLSSLPSMCRKTVTMSVVTREKASCHSSIHLNVHMVCDWEYWYKDTVQFSP